MKHAFAVALLLVSLASAALAEGVGPPPNASSASTVFAEGPGMPPSSLSNSPAGKP